VGGAWYSQAARSTASSSRVTIGDLAGVPAMSRPAERVVAFYNKRGTAEQGISGSGHFQTAQAKLIDRLGARLSFILGIPVISADKPQN
jgi:hypothetical protein